MKSLFIVFEGIDGSGTSTQAAQLQKYFLRTGIDAVLTEEPSNGPIGHMIREALKKRVLFTNNRRHFDQQLAFLFAADRHDHLYNEIDGVFKLLEEGKHVISTRYYFSSLAYQADEGHDLVYDLNKRFPKPDIVIYIDNPVETSLERLQHRTIKDVYENKEKLFKVKQKYKQIFNEYDGNLFIVEGNQTLEEIHDQICKYINAQLNIH
ncbi:dTMP kinase [Bacillus kwashiorkori]|uniref:dTMP kinase n=1 Tax=Bacillus kwashiorkori TaxID=1522318 RepID=UPI0007802FC0|nr:dTMP kinase [Bacillus kwashiorkori]